VKIKGVEETGTVRKENAIRGGVSRDIRKGTRRLGGRYKNTGENKPANLLFWRVCANSQGDKQPRGREFPSKEQEKMKGRKREVGKTKRRLNRGKVK